MRQIDFLLSEYGKSHQNKTNKLIHWIMVPAIFFSIVGLVMSIPFPVEKTMFLNWASFALVLALLYYFSLSKPLFLGFCLWALFCLFGNYQIWQAVDFSNKQLAIVSFIIFFVAWVFQFVGHKIEGAKPSFLDDIKFLLVGPAWLMHFIYKQLGIKY